MTLTQLISLARTFLRDKREPYFWTDEELTEFLNSAVEEACVRARLLESTLIIPVTAGDDAYTPSYTVQRYTQVEAIEPTAVVDTAGAFLVGRWYQINSPGTTNFVTIGAANSTAGTFFKATGVGSGTGTAYLCTNTRLTPLTQAQFASISSVDYTATGQLLFYTVDESTLGVKVHPIPAINSALFATVRRLPASSELLINGSDIPVIPERFHRDLVYWVLAQAYSVDVNDTKSNADSDKNEAKFEARFGRRPTARGEVQGLRSIVGSDLYPQRFGG